MQLPQRDALSSGLRTSPLPEARPRTRRQAALLRLPLVLLPLALLAGCSDDDDDDGRDRRTEFGATLDEAQEVPAPTEGTRVRVTITNLAPAQGTFQAPVWVGLHDGSFDLYDVGEVAATFFPTTNALEALAEDGLTEPLSTAFRDAGGTGAQDALTGTLGPAAGPLAPGETRSVVLEVDPSQASSRYFSYASMVLPSNDAFVANGDPMAHEIFDASGDFVASDFVVAGTEVLDAGTEVNDEEPDNTAFFGQTDPDTGVDENGVVAQHPGFDPPGSGGILDDPMFAEADFTAMGYQVLAFRFDELDAAPPASGLASVALQNGNSEVDVRVTATGLSGSVSGVHLHEAAAGETGPIVVDLTDGIELDEDGDLVVEGTFPTTGGFASALRAGSIYVNVHTTLNPSGELRGQLDATEAFGGVLDTEQEVPAPTQGMGVRVTVTNDAPDLGTYQTPVWVGFHDGNFDPYDLGAPASTYFPSTDALERLAEDGLTDDLVDAFRTQAFGTTQGVLAGRLGPMDGPIAPGETVSDVFRVDPTAVTSGYIGFASMVIPSNDAFVALDDPTAVQVYDTNGELVASDLSLDGSAVLDAGTEVNDEVPTNTAFFGQTDPDTGVDENGVVQPHPGYMSPGSGGILDDPDFAEADFTQPGYELLSLRLDEVAPGDPATGLVVARLSDDESEVEFGVLVRDLSGPATGMHFHEGAPGTAGPVVIDLTDTIDRNEDGVLTARGTRATDPAFLDALRAGDIYLNVHTSLNPAGEVRGQVTLRE